METGAEELQVGELDRDNLALGFLVGFGSDQILASIRNMVKSPPSPSAGQATLNSSVTGTVKQGNTPVADATVELLGTTITARTNAKGEFSLIAVPVKADTYLMKVSFANKSKDVPVIVNDAKPVKVLEPIDILS